MTQPNTRKTPYWCMPTLTRDQWVAVLSVSQDADVDPDLWERPGEYFGAKVMMYLEASLRETLNLGEDFETRISLLSPAEGWAVVHVCEAYWHRPDPSVSMDEFINWLLTQVPSAPNIQPLLRPRKPGGHPV